MSGKFECKECKMKYDTFQQLENHKKKFCQDSDYSKLTKLDEIYQTQKMAQKMTDVDSMIGNNKYEINRISKKPSTPLNTSINNGQKQFLKQIGGQALQDIRQQIRNQEDDLKKLRDNQGKDKYQQQDDFVSQLIFMKNDMDYSFKQDQKKIQDALQRVERLNLIGENPKLLVSRLQKLNALLSEREALRNQEYNLAKDFEELQIKKLQNLDIIQMTGDGKQSIMGEKDTLSILQNRKQLIDKERERIMRDLDSVEGKNENFDSNNNQNLDISKNYQNNNNSYRPYTKQRQDSQQLRTGNNILNNVNPYNNLYNQQNQITYHNNNKEVYVQDNDEGYQYNNHNQNNNQPEELHIHHLPVNQQQPQYQPQMMQPQYQPQLLPPQQIYLPPQQIQQQIPQQQQPIPIVVDQSQNGTVGPDKIIQNHVDDDLIQIEETPFAIFTKNRENLLQNGDINPELESEERMLLLLQREEVDELRILSRIPVGSELYRFKMEQYKELSTRKSEIEKIVLEQQLQKMKRAYESERRQVDRQYENEKWIDQQRKFIIQNSVRK